MLIFAKTYFCNIKKFKKYEKINFKKKCVYRQNQSKNWESKKFSLNFHKKIFVFKHIFCILYAFYIGVYLQGVIKTNNFFLSDQAYNIIILKEAPLFCRDKINVYPKDMLNTVFKLGIGSKQLNSVMTPNGFYRLYQLNMTAPNSDTFYYSVLFNPVTTNFVTRIILNIVCLRVRNNHACY